MNVLLWQKSKHSISTLCVECALHSIFQAMGQNNNGRGLDVSLNSWQGCLFSYMYTGDTWMTVRDTENGCWWICWGMGCQKKSPGCQLEGSGAILSSNHLFLSDELSHTHARAHTYTQCAFTVCYSVTAVTLGIFSSCSLCCQTHTPWSSKTGLYRLQPVADCKADLLSVVMLLPHDFFFFSWNLNYSTGIPLKMDLCTTLQIFLFPALWHHKTHHLHLFKHLIFTG